MVGGASGSTGPERSLRVCEHIRRVPILTHPNGCVAMSEFARLIPRRLRPLTASDRCRYRVATGAAIPGRAAVLSAGVGCDECGDGDGCVVMRSCLHRATSHRRDPSVCEGHPIRSDRRAASAIVSIVNTASPSAPLAALANGRAGAASRGLAQPWRREHVATDEVM
jgi:hypothetical protein